MSGFIREVCPKNEHRKMSTVTGSQEFLTGSSVWLSVSTMDWSVQFPVRVGDLTDKWHYSVAGGESCWNPTNRVWRGGRDRVTTVDRRLVWHVHTRYDQPSSLRLSRPTPCKEVYKEYRKLPSPCSTLLTDSWIHKWVVSLLTTTIRHFLFVSDYMCNRPITTYKDSTDDPYGNIESITVLK